MTSPKILVLGGTYEARLLAKEMALAQMTGVLSLAGRVERPLAQSLPLRIGGFGGVTGLLDYLTHEEITHVIDATHPFAAQMSRNAITACDLGRIPLLALERAAWAAQIGDDWRHVSDISAAAAWLSTQRPMHILLAIGRQHVDDFTIAPQHHYLLRLIDAPQTPPHLPQHHIILDRGPFDLAGDLALLQQHKINLIVSKNAGGSAAIAKIDAARHLHLPVVMIARPELPPRQSVADIAGVMAWLRAAHR